MVAVGLAILVVAVTVVLASNSRRSPTPTSTPESSVAAPAAAPVPAATASPAPTPARSPQPVVVTADRSLNLSVYSQVDGRPLAVIPSGLGSIATMDMNVGQDIFMGDGSVLDDVARTTFNQSLTKVALIHKVGQDYVPAYWDMPTHTLVDVVPPADHSGFEVVDPVRTLGVAYDPGSENFWYLTADDANNMILVGPGYRRTIPGSEQQVGPHGPFFRFPEAGRAPDVKLSVNDFNGRTGESVERPDEQSTMMTTPPRRIFDTDYRTPDILPPTRLDPTDVLRADNDPDTGFFFTTTGTVGLWKVPIAGGRPTMVAPMTEEHANVIRATIMQILRSGSRSDERDHAASSSRATGMKTTSPRSCAALARLFVVAGRVDPGVGAAR